MKIVICDDEKSSIEYVKECINKSNSQFLDLEITEFTDGESLIEAVKKDLKIDILFIDIEMKNINGIEAAKFVRKYCCDAIIIFVSNHKERVFETLECEVFNFLTKPFTFEEFDNVFSSAIEKYKLLYKCFIINWKNTSIKLNINEIKYIESYKRHVIFYTIDSKYEMVSKLSDVSKRLLPYGFVQTHQGYCVNMKFIKNFDELDVVLTDNTKVPISMRKRKNVLSSYSKYIEKYKG